MTAPTPAPTVSIVLAGSALMAALGTLSAAAAPSAPSSTPAGAASSTAVAPSEAFDVARRLWETGDFTTALVLFERALASTGSPNARLYVARCLRDLGRLPEAYDEMSRTVRDAMALAEQEERYAATRNTAAAELALLEPKVARLMVALGPKLAEANVTIGGKPIERARLSQPIAVAPGHVQVVARTARGQSEAREVEAVAGVVTTVSFDASATAGPAAPTATSSSPAAPPDAPSEDSEAGFGVVRGVGIVVAAIGVAGFVTFGVERAQADAEIATLEQECGVGPCVDPSYSDVVDRGKTAEMISAIGLAVGIAGVIAGTAMIVFGGEGDPSAESAWSPTANGMRWRF